MAINRYCIFLDRQKNTITTKRYNNHKDFNRIPHDFKRTPQRCNHTVKQMDSKRNCISFCITLAKKNFEKDLDRFSAELENRFFCWCFWENCCKQTADMLQQDCAFFLLPQCQMAFVTFPFKWQKVFILLVVLPSKTFLETIEIMQSSYKSCVK